MKVRVAVTGGIGSGKSTALAILQGFGYSVFSCDEIYKNLIKSEEYVALIRQRFGCVKDGKIELDKLSALVFADPKKREQLNALAHPLIMKELISLMDSAPTDVVFAEVPLLLEGGFEGLFDKVLVILREKQTRVASVVCRDALSEEQILARINSQIDYDCDTTKNALDRIGAYVIENDADVTSLRNKLEIFLKNIQS